MFYWGVLFAIFAIGEILIPGLVSVWLAIAALIMMPISLFVKSLEIQAIIFCVLSLIFIAFFRKIFKFYLNGKESLGTEKVKIVKLTSVENDNYIYDVRFKGGIWTAIANLELKPGDIANIVKFEGNKIILGRN
ncbi:NfeD family protein [Lachnoanaerobaculum sp. Marseille-Q4761]|jgi:hypothetical protein|uniref:NfeD family protein n=1 Tax=Lachnoanaerobaculum sp. Marseille-Q4761 TaxID=2819511 RepID=UPI000F251F01|nr:NfeD family protein [Lachnoanaerobaculum sp. Marseille-Q4761]MBO1870271.1 NfeD family protein [Lachnoanaerobaculum sp. Marseille-Q4761]RKW45520.1 MAG: NfeD family protein [Lachnospiraceae bacterium]